VKRLRANDACWCGSGHKLKRCHGDREALRRPAVRRGVPAARRAVPDSIARPPYLETGGKPTGSAGRQVFDAAGLAAMRRAGRVAAQVLLDAGAAVRPGVTTAELNDVAHDSYVRQGAYPSTLGYRGFGHAVCTSVNEVACHGIPDSRPLADGDVVNIDVTAYVDGYHGDTSATFAVGTITTATEALIAATCDATLAGIAAVVPGRSINEIGRAVEAVARPRGFGIVTMYGGHGIGTVFHAAPHIHHVSTPAATAKLVPGMTFTVEPMLTAGTEDLAVWDDGWTEVTVDGLVSAQFEHTVAVTDDGVEILTVTGEGRSAVTWPNAIVGTSAVAAGR
jgi:methionyl aminopeptidase